MQESVLGIREDYCINRRLTQLLHSPLCLGHQHSMASLAAIPNVGFPSTRPVPALPGLPGPISRLTSSWKLFLSQYEKKGKAWILKIVYKMAFVCLRMCMCAWGHVLDVRLYFFMKTKKEIISGDFGCPGPRYVNH